MSDELHFCEICHCEIEGSSTFHNVCDYCAISENPRQVEKSLSRYSVETKKYLNARAVANNIKIATYEEFCAHYELDLSLDESKDRYQEYLEMLDFTNSLFAE